MAPTRLGTTKPRQKRAEPRRRRSNRAVDACSGRIVSRTFASTLLAVETEAIFLTTVAPSCARRAGSSPAQAATLESYAPSSR